MRLAFAICAAGARRHEGNHGLDIRRRAANLFEV
jgi:hypothetical protein